MNKARIKEEAEHFFEWSDSKRRDHVTLTSCLIFAEVIAGMAVDAEREGWQDTVKKILVEVKKSDERYMNLFKINNELIELIQKAKSQEREECAKLAAWILKMPENDVSSAIRERGMK